MIGAYTATKAFAYPGWRLTVPGGPAGGHYKGFTHTQAAGTDILPGDSYEQDREDGMSSHDPVHATPRNPRGVYRSSAEVPPRPNASGQAHTYRGFQTQRHAGTSVAPGSFPAPFIETDEDAFLQRFAELEGLGAFYPFPTSQMIRVGTFTNGGPAGPVWSGGSVGPITFPVVNRPNTTPPMPAPMPVAPPSTGATSVVNQPTGTLTPAPPAPSVPVYTAPPISPTPAPVVCTNEVVPRGDGTYWNVSTGQIVPAGAVEENPATGQLTASSSLSWFEEHSMFSALPNWGVLAIGLLGASFLFGRRR